MTNPNSSYQPLLAVYQAPEIQTNARDVDQVLGFICAIAASPEPIALQEWFPNLWLDGNDPSFTEQTLAVNFGSAVLQFHDDCLNNYQHGAPLVLPEQSWLDTNNAVTAQGSAFASGYLLASQKIEPCWQALNLAPDSQPEQLLQTAMLLLSKMANPSTTDPQIQALFAQLPEMAEIVSALPRLLATLGHVAVTNEND